MTDLAAILGRDAEAAEYVGPDPDKDTIGWLADSYRNAAVDRRVLLDLLRETRDLIESINACHRCLDNSGSDDEKVLFASLHVLANGRVR